MDTIRRLVAEFRDEPEQGCSMLALVRTAVEASPLNSTWEVTDFGWLGWNQRPGLSPWEVEATLRESRTVLFGRDELCDLLQNLSSIDDSSFDAYERVGDISGNLHVLRWLARVDAYDKFEFATWDLDLLKRIRATVSVQCPGALVYENNAG